MSTTVERPGSVTFVVVLTWLYAIATILVGAMWLFASGDSDLLGEVDATSAEARTYGGAALAIGILIALTALALGAGSRFARFLVITVMVLRIGVDVFALLMVDGYPWWQAAIAIGWAVLIIALLSTRRAAQFFLQR